MAAKNNFDIDLGLQGSLAVVSGAGGQIGQVIVQAFLSAGCYVAAIDIDDAKFNIRHENLFWYKADVTNEKEVTRIFYEATERCQRVPAICITAAGLDLSFIEHHKSAKDLSVAQFRRTIDVNLVGTFVTAKAWMKWLGVAARDEIRNASLILVGSEAGSFGVPGNPDYAASKAGVQYGLTRSLAPDAASLYSRARVNAIAPGPVDTPQFRRECKNDPSGQSAYVESIATVALKRSIPMEDVARTCLFLASERFASSITGQILPIDAGKSGKIYWDKEGSAAW